MKLSLMLMFISVFCASCTYTVSMVNTHGKASDVIDDTATITPSTSVNLPTSLIPK